MRKHYTYIVFTVLLALLGFSSVTYTSCARKEDGDATFGCDTVQCMNLGSCSYGKCVCPSGYDGIDCSEVLVDKFIGMRWTGQERIVKSSSPIWIDTVAAYSIRTRTGNTPTSFFVDSIWGDRYKSNIVCEIKSPTTFDVLTFQPINNNNPHTFKIMGGYGSIDTLGAKDVLSGIYYRYISDSLGARTDTLEFKFTKD